jgi:hypothetical protein
VEWRYSDEDPDDDSAVGLLGVCGLCGLYSELASSSDMSELGLGLGGRVLVLW